MLLCWVWRSCWDWTSYSRQKWGRTTFQHILLESRFVHSYIISIFWLCSMFLFFFTIYCYILINDITVLLSIKKGRVWGFILLAWKFETLAEANLLFVESPVGVGFSYTNTSSDLTILEDSFVGEFPLPKINSSDFVEWLKWSYLTNYLYQLRMPTISWWIGYKDSHSSNPGTFLYQEKAMVVSI